VTDLGEFQCLYAMIFILPIMYGSCFVLFSLLVGKCLLITKSIPYFLFLCAMVLLGRSRAICFLFGPIHQDLNRRVCPESKVIFQLFCLLKRLCSLPLSIRFTLTSCLRPVRKLFSRGNKLSKVRKQHAIFTHKV
jgi:hypothetical protein